ncbi:DNA replication and repair protein RecF [uncultured Alphaproteobacteria bacterium]|uniref:DNA replication and repair protein RecF n=1 Tax=uncultured Alphaproteobacteria bacterium TaxID=91750 RepID=A0A212K998_9PROT|nr:DNA replication and repair protein RecF [uncultured Alphaproteobacteria bacterium]
MERTVRVPLEADARTAVRRLTLTGFRCYARLRLDLGAEPVVLTGPNGAGKTNLLEAVSFLTPGRGLRRARLAEVARQGGAASWAVAAEATSGGERVRVGTGWSGDGPDKRVVRMDGQPLKTMADLGRVLPVLWLTPAMDRLFVEGAGQRRRFMDRMVNALDPGHAERAAAYERAMRQRLALLKEGRRDAAWLAALEAVMAAQGVAVAAARCDWLARLAPLAAEGHGPFPGCGLALAGEIEAELAEGASALAVEDRFRDRLAANRGLDAAAGATTEGPHRGDLAAVHLGKDMPAHLASTGEQKALLIGLVLAQAKVVTRGVPPLLLLDEVAAHLDAPRRAALFDVLAAHPGQSWLTGTDAHLFAALAGRARFLTVADAAVCGEGVLPNQEDQSS